MKRQNLAICCAALLLLTTGCSSQPSSTSSGNSSSSSSEEAQQPNPMVSYETPDFTEVAGFSLSNLPERDDVTLDQCWLIDEAVAQLDFLFEEELEGTLRVAKGEDQDISGISNLEFESDSIQDYDGVQVRIQESAGGPALATWNRYGYTFSLYLEQTQMGLLGGVLPSFVSIEVTPVLVEDPAPTEEETALAQVSDSAAYDPQTNTISFTTPDQLPEGKLLSLKVSGTVALDSQNTQEFTAFTEESEQCSWQVATPYTHQLGEQPLKSCQIQVGLVNQPGEEPEHPVTIYLAGDGSKTVA